MYKKVLDKVRHLFANLCTKLNFCFFSLQFLESHPETKNVGTLTKDEWEAITLYLVFAFKKKRN